MVRRRWSRLILAMAVAGATFGIATVVQAAIPDATGTAHGCVAKNVVLPNKTFLRMVDSERGETCLPTEWVVNFAATAGPISQIPPTNDVFYGNGISFNVGGGGTTTIGSVAVPAGSYLVSATGWMASFSPGFDYARCFINSATGDPSDTFTSTGQESFDVGQTSWAVQKLVSTAGGTFFARCLDASAAGAVLYGAQITALEVGTLNGTVFPAGVSGGATSPMPNR
jgi:hypothetical protein